MSDRQLILFDDERARNWYPFTLTRPAGELRFGALTLRARAEQVFQARCIGHIADLALQGFSEPEAAPVLAQIPDSTKHDRLFLSSRAVAAWDARLPSTRSALRIGDQVAGLFCPAGSDAPSSADLLQLSLSDALELPGFVLTHVWELIARNAPQTESDLEHMYGTQWSKLPAGVSALGEPRFSAGASVAIEPGVVLDFRSGPIRLDDGVEVRAFTRLAGPSAIARNTALLGGSFSSVSIGPQCKVHGEMEATIVLGYSNKAHDGFLGHAYLGCWVNLGALTSNSDLKNNYGSVRLWTPAGEVDTGEMKVGCFLGDHVKTAIGCMLNTGTIVGTGSNLFGGMPEKHVPPFRWGVEQDAYAFDKFIATAETAMGRRSVPLPGSQRELLHRLWRLQHQSAGHNP
ncbi:MAG: putative sugar nucleotidyl transferase [Longimicrobiales bacterium]